MRVWGVRIMGVGFIFGLAVPAGFRQPVMGFATCKNERYAACQKISFRSRTTTIKPMRKITPTVPPMNFSMLSPAI